MPQRFVVRGQLLGTSVWADFNYFLRVIPTLTHYSDIVSDIPSGSIYGIYVLTFFLACSLTFYLTYYLASIQQYFLAYNFLTFFLAFYLCILIFCLAFYLATCLAFSLAFSLACVRVQAWPTASGVRDSSGPGLAHYIRSFRTPGAKEGSRSRRKSRRKKKRRRRKRSCTFVQI